METNMILSASGWRKVFAISGQEQDRTPMIGEDNIAISIYASSVFADYVIEKSVNKKPVIILGMDARPTGDAICEACIKTFLTKNVEIKFSGIIAAPEIMAFSRKYDAFMYISASHNPIGHNGIKFGMNTGGVLNAKENAILTEKFKTLCSAENARQKAFDIIQNVSEEKIAGIYKNKADVKKEALDSYKKFLRETITAEKDFEKQEEIFQKIRSGIKNRSIGVVCDMNGSARSLSVDSDFFKENGINFYAINNKAGNIVHEIIPESENLIYVASEMEKLQKEGHSDAILGYMPDCDGDRGNIVYWDEKQNKAVILKAQEVFSFSVLSELLYSLYLNKNNSNYKSAVCVNCPTSMRINELASLLNTEVFRAEVGEANVVNLAEKIRSEGFDVRIFGEGSNGGTITYPSAVRDPLNTIFAIVKLLTIDELYSFWCKKINKQYKKDFSLTDVLNTIPEYTTTGVSEKRAVLKIKNTDHAQLKANFQKVFEKEWKEKADFVHNFGIFDYQAVITNGIIETIDVNDFSKSAKGGLKIIFKNKSGQNIAFIWMRGSGTEPVFRIMCDVKGKDEKAVQMEKELLEWETQMLLKADEM